VTGRLLGYRTIADAMGDKRLVKFIKRAAAEELLPVVEPPGVIEPEEFLREVLEERFPNPYIPDTPARIACDTSQKIPVRFGEAVREWAKRGKTGVLELIPLFAALWLRYLLGIGDGGEPIEPSPDPRLDELQKKLAGVEFGRSACADSIMQILSPILSDETIFCVDLTRDADGFAIKTRDAFVKLISGPGAVSKTLDDYFG